jgi:cell division protein ZapA
MVEVAMRNKVGVRISGKEYTLVGEESERYILNLAYFVDKKISEMLKLNPMLSTSMAAVLTSVNVADEYLKLAKQESEISQKLTQKTQELQEVNAQIAELTDALRQSRKERDLTNQENKHLEQALNQKNDEVEDYKMALERSSKVRFYTKGS